jgi:hypothetical protein
MEDKTMGEAEKKDNSSDGDSEKSEPKKPLITFDDGEPDPADVKADGETEGEGDGAEGEDGKESGGQEGEPEGDGQAGEADDDDQQDQIVREGETQPQATTPRGFLKRIKKLNGRVVSAKVETDEFKERNEILEDQNKVQKMRIEQLEGQPKTEPLKRPDVIDFDGAYDPEYQKAVDDYQDQRQDARLNKRFAEQTQHSTVTNDQTALAQKLQQKQLAHVERASKLKVKDYEETEDVAISILGSDKVNHIIMALPEKSELLLYYLGKNSDVAQKYSDMLETETVRALMELGGILSEIKVKSVSKKSLKDPDEDLEGGNLPTGKKKRGPVGATFA